MRLVQSSRFRALTVAVLCLTACAGGRNKKSPVAKWLDQPTTATKEGEKLTFEGLDIVFVKPDTLYVFRECGEAGHSPEGESGWIPVVTCSSVHDEGDDEMSGDAPESISLKFYATKRTRPLDERTVSWFENQYKQAGFQVDEISYQHEYQNKSGIYAKLQLIDKSTGLPTREIIQFMFPKEDVVFIARTEYTFGDSRAIQQDWKYLLWNFDIDPHDDVGPTVK